MVPGQFSWSWLFFPYSFSWLQVGLYGLLKVPTGFFRVLGCFFVPGCFLWFFTVSGWVFSESRLVFHCSTWVLRFFLRFHVGFHDSRWVFMVFCTVTGRILLVPGGFSWIQLGLYGYSMFLVPWSQVLFYGFHGSRLDYIWGAKSYIKNTPEGTRLNCILIPGPTTPSAKPCPLPVVSRLWPSVDDDAIPH